MAQIYNSDLTQELINGAKIQQNRDTVPNQIADKVVPVMEVNPKLLRRVNVIRHGYATNAATATIYTTPADQEFYLTECCLSWVKDAGSDATTAYLTVNNDGVSGRRLLVLTGITGVATAQTMAVTFNPPILVDKNSSVVVNNNTATANVSAVGSIAGYVVQNIKA